MTHLLDGSGLPSEPPTSPPLAPVLDPPLAPPAPPPAPPTPPAAADEQPGGAPDDAAPTAASGAWWPRALGAAIVVLSFGLNAWALSRNGLGNTFYSAGSRAMSESWRNFFFNAFDPGGFITVDKPPVAMWIEALSVRTFGFSSWSLLLPSAVAGAASVGVLWTIVRRWFGVPAAAIAALVLALSPINVAVNRLNLPDPFMVLFLLLAAWAVLRSLDSHRWAWWLVTAGVLAGVAFNTKMLAAFIPLPALALAVLVGSRCGWWSRLWRLVVLGATTLAVSASWMLVVDLWPASSRPYVGGSVDNSVWDLIVGYNGLGRVDGQGQGFGGGGGGGIGGPGGVFGGAPGWLRMFNDAVGGQIAWLLPLAVVGAGLALWAFRRRPRRLAAIALFSGWFALYFVVFSLAEGTFHSYYTSALAPAVGALVGIGSVALVRLARRQPAWLAVAGAAVLGTAALQLSLSGRTPDFQSWTRPVLVLGVVAAGVALAVAVAQRRFSWVLGALAVALAALLVTPAAWAANETTAASLNATLPQAGPRQGAAGRTFGSGAFDATPGLADWLRSANDGERWDLVTTSSQSASDLIAADDLSVMSLGGFMGSDPAATVASTADKVAAGEVRYFLVSGGFPGGGPPGGGPPGAGSGAGRFPGAPSLGRGGPTAPGGSTTGPGGFPGGGLPGGVRPGGGRGGPGGGTASQIMAAVEQSCTAVTSASTGGALPSSYDGQIYDCAGRADALRAAG